MSIRGKFLDCIVENLFSRSLVAMQSVHVALSLYKESELKFLDND